MTGSPNKNRKPAHVPSAKQYAIKLLSYRGRSEKEMRERLVKKGFSADVVTQTVEFLRKSGFLDDTALAENLKRDAFSRKMLSRRGAKQYMLSRGIPLPVIETAIVGDERIDIENAKRIVEKKMKVLKNYAPEIIRRRLYNVLSRRGYASETIRTVLKDNFSYKEDI